MANLSQQTEQQSSDEDKDVQVYAYVSALITDEGIANNFGISTEVKNAAKGLAALCFLLKYGNMIEKVIEDFQQSCNENSCLEQFNEFMEKWNEMKQKHLEDQEKKEGNKNEVVVQPLYVDM